MKKLAVLCPLLVILCGCAGVDPAVTVINGLPVRCAFIELDAYNRVYKTPDGTNEIRSITIHNTAEQLSARQEWERVYFRQDNIHAAFHFAVDENEAVQLLPLNRRAWHAGDGMEGGGNAHSIAIEICRSQCYGDREELYRRAEANAVILAAHLLVSFNLPVEALKKHQDWSGKYCPHRILQEGRWEAFKAAVEANMRSTPSVFQAESEAVTVGGTPNSPVFKTFYGEIFHDPAALIRELKERGRLTVDISSWQHGAEKESHELLEKLRGSGLKVNSFYILKTGEKNYLREDITRPAREYREYLDSLSEKK